MQRQTLSIAAVLIGLLSMPAPGVAQDRAGDATRVQRDASQVRAGQTSAPLATGDVVYQQARLQTAKFGSADILLDDDARLVIGPDSDVVIDEYVYAPNGSTGRATIRMGVGLLRMVSGRMPREGIRITTPIATVGIRGTDFTLDTRTPGLLRVWVEEGQVEIIPNESGLVFDFAALAQIDCTSNFCRTGPGGEVPRAFPARTGDDVDDQQRRGGGFLDVGNDADRIGGGEGGGGDGGGRR